MKSGDPCSKCVDGTMKTYSTLRHGERAVRYLKCDGCGFTGKQFLPVEKLRVVTRRLVNDTSGRSVSADRVRPEEMIPGSEVSYERVSNVSEFISLPSLAARMEVDEPSLLRLIRDGDVPAPVIIGGLARFDAFTLASWRAAGCPKGEPCGHRVMHAIRRALIDEGDARFDASMARLSDALDAADADTLARVQELLNVSLP